MNERAVLIVAVVLLCGGLGVWAYVARQEGGAVVRRDAPLRPRVLEVGVPIVTTDPSAVAARRAFEAAVMAPVPVARLFRRSGQPVHVGRVPGRDALSIWERLGAQTATSHLTPIILGDGYSAREQSARARTTTDTPAAVVARAARIDREGWLRARMATLDARDGVWPEGAQPDESWRALRDPRMGLYLPEIVIALIPSDASEDAFAWMAFGNFEGCPEPAVHISMSRYLQETYGARLVVMTESSVELSVAHPPDTRVEALALARTLVAYAPAILEGGRRSIADVAASLLGATHWALVW